MVSTPSDAAVSTDPTASVPLLPPSLIGRILSYNVATTKDLARLRLIHKSVSIPATSAHTAIRVPNRSWRYIDEVLRPKGDLYESSSIFAGECWTVRSLCGDAAGSFIRPFAQATIKSIHFVGKPIKLDRYVELVQSKRAETVT